MKISYVLPVYNSVPFLHQTIKTIMEQIHDDFEIIVVNDASTDKIYQLKEFYAQFPKIRWFDNAERMGAAACRNVGNSSAEGDIIAVCDCGDVYNKARGKMISEFFEKNPGISIVYSHVNVVSLIEGLLYTQEAKEWDGNSKPNISHPTVAYRKEVASKIKYCAGSLDTDFYEFFLIDAFRAGFKFGFIKSDLCNKYELSDAEGYRDIMKARELKKKKYEEYGIKLKEGEM